MKIRTYASVEWTLELQGEIPRKVACAGVATVIKVKSIGRLTRTRIE